MPRASGSLHHLSTVTSIAEWEPRRICCRATVQKSTAGKWVCHSSREAPSPPPKKTWVPPRPRAKGHARAGGVRTWAVSELQPALGAGIKAFSLVTSRQCHGGCTAAVGVECVARKQRACQPDAHGNVGQGNEGSGNFGVGNQGQVRGSDDGDTTGGAAAGLHQSVEHHHITPPFQDNIGSQNHGSSNLGDSNQGNGLVGCGLSGASLAERGTALLASCANASIAWRPLPRPAITSVAVSGTSARVTLRHAPPAGAAYVVRAVPAGGRAAAELAVRSRATLATLHPLRAGTSYNISVTLVRGAFASQASTAAGVSVRCACQGECGAPALACQIIRPSLSMGPPSAYTCMRAHRPHPPTPTRVPAACHPSRKHHPSLDSPSTQAHGCWPLSCRLCKALRPWASA